MNSLNLLGQKAQTIRARNRQLVFNLVTAQGPISRVVIARQLNLSVTAVSDILTDLQEVGLVEEAGHGVSNGGRPPILLRASSDRVCLLGLFLSANEIRAVLTDPGGRILGRLTHAVASSLEPAELMRKLADAGRQTLADHQGNRALVAFGLAVSAPVSRSGRVRPPDMVGWETSDIRVIDYLIEAFGVMGVIDNDANLGALAELRYGDLSDTQNLVYVLVHQGVGAGIVYDGRIFRGAMNWAGELGHVVIDPSGPLCNCGNYGCLESFVSTQRLVEYAIAGVKLGRPTTLKPFIENRLDSRQVVDAAIDGDQAAIAALEQVGEWLGLGFTNLVSLIDPDLVILGGPLARAGDLVLGPAEKIARQRLLPDFQEHVKFAVSRLGGDGPALGAVAFALDKLLARDDFAVTMRRSMSVA